MVPDSRVYNLFSQRDRPAESLHRAANHCASDGRFKQEYPPAARDPLGGGGIPPSPPSSQQLSEQQYAEGAQTEKRRTVAVYQQQVSVLGRCELDAIRCFCLLPACCLLPRYYCCVLLLLLAAADFDWVTVLHC